MKHVYKLTVNLVDGIALTNKNVVIRFPNHCRLI